MRARIIRCADHGSLGKPRDTWDVWVGDKVIANTDTRAHARKVRDEYNAIAALIHWASHRRRRYLAVIRYDAPAGEKPAHRVDVTGRNENAIEKIMRGMLRNMSDEYGIDDRIEIERVEPT